VVGAAGQSALRALVATATLGVTATLGAAEARTFTLAYSAPEGCPARSTFVASIRARAESRELEQHGELAFEVALEPVGELTRGRLTVRFSGGERFERELPAARCADVTTTMAIMAGLLLSGSLLPEPPPPEPEPEPEPALPPPTPPRPPTLPVAPPAPVTPSSAASFGHFRVGAAAHAELDLGALPFPALGASFGLDAAVERPSWFSPSLRAGFVYLTAKASHPPEGDARFTLRALFVRLCPLRFELRAPLAVTACALLDAGGLEVAGRSTTLPEDVSMTWVAVGAAGRLSARLTPVLTLEAEARLHGLIRHDRFVLQPGAVQIHEIPTVSAGLGVGLLAQLP
jgi:hypothetical protein